MYIQLRTFYTEKTVSLNQRKIYLLYGQKKYFFELKKVLLIQKNFLRSKEINLFTLKNIFLNQQNFLRFKENVFWVIELVSSFASVKCWADDGGLCLWHPVPKLKETEFGP